MIKNKKPLAVYRRNTRRRNIVEASVWMLDGGYFVKAVRIYSNGTDWKKSAYFSLAELRQLREVLKEAREHCVEGVGRCRTEN